MKIGIITRYPHLFTLGLAQVLKLTGSVNVLSKGFYNDLLFKGDDKEQERDGILFNSGDFCDYELEINPETDCDVHIYLTKPYYRELKETPEIKENSFLVVEMPSADLKYGKKLILSEYTIPADRYFEFVPEEKDIVADYHLGVKPNFSLDKLSKTYQRLLLELYNRIHGTTYTKLRQLSKKKKDQKTSSTEGVSVDKKEE